MTLIDTLRGLMGKQDRPIELDRRDDGRTISGLRLWVEGANAISGKTVERLTIEDSVLVVNGGADVATVNITWGDVTLRRCILAVVNQVTKDRHSLPAAVRTLHARTDMRECVVLGGNSGVVCGNDSNIAGNWILPGGYATNCYGVVLYRVGGCMVRDNVILPLAGFSSRGVQVNGGDGGELQGRPVDKQREGINNVVLRNLILAAERPQQSEEFPARDLTAAGLRSRYGAVGLFQDNDVLALAGGPFCNAAAAYVGHHPVQDGIPLESRFIGNALTAVALDYDFDAKCLTLEDHRDAPDRFAGNWFGGNHIWISTSGYDRNGIQSRPITASRFTVASAKALMDRWCTSAYQRVESALPSLRDFLYEQVRAHDQLVTSAQDPERHVAFYGSEHDGDERVEVTDWPYGIEPSVARRHVRQGEKRWGVSPV